MCQLEVCSQMHVELWMEMIIDQTSCDENSAQSVHTMFWLSWFDSTDTAVLIKDGVLIKKESH